MAPRVFDCVLYNGELEILLLRLHELKEAVDVFVIVEATRTFSGEPRPLHLRSHWATIRPFARKIRYVVIADDIAEGNARDREAFQRNAVQRGLLDAADNDLICVSAVYEIPKADVIRHLKDAAAGLTGLKLATSRYFLNYRNIGDAKENLALCCAFPKVVLQNHTPDQLREGIRHNTIAAIYIDDAGWHFSRLADSAGHITKIAAHSAQDLTHPLEPVAIDLQETRRHSDDFQLHDGTSWAVVALDDLPAHVRENPDSYGHLMVKADSATAVRMGEKTFDAAQPVRPSIEKQPPIIICPYVFDEDREHTIQAFGLDQPHGCHLPFFFWKDEKLIGPERAFEQCWKQFPDRDVIIVHTDMRPMPDDVSNAWYTALCAQVDQLPDAGLVGCDLLYPLKSAAGLWYVQCAGGFFKNGRVTHFGGGVALAEGVATADAYEYDARFAMIRKSQWVTFGGVYVRRETIDMVGDFDERYQWAYVMDVDYCLEAHVRGQGIYQVPVNLLHEESKTSRKFLSIPEYGTKIGDNMDKFLQKWAWFLSSQT